MSHFNEFCDYHEEDGCDKPHVCADCKEHFCGEVIRTCTCGKVLKCMDCATYCENYNCVEECVVCDDCSHTGDRGDDTEGKICVNCYEDEHFND